MRRISLRLPDELAARLDSAATARRVTRSRFILESLERAFDQPPRLGLSCYDLAHDLVGAVKGLPEDLADDPRHLAEFGHATPARRRR